MTLCYFFTAHFHNITLRWPTEKHKLKYTTNEIPLMTALRTRGSPPSEATAGIGERPWQPL